MNNEEGKSCGCPCHKMDGILIALIGIVILLGRFEILAENIVGTTWPILLILLGFKKSFGKGKCKCCKKA